MSLAESGPALPYPTLSEGLISPFQKRLEARQASEAETSTTKIFTLLASSLKAGNIEPGQKPQAFSEWFANLSLQESENLKKHWGEDNLPKLISLAKEPDAEMFAQGLLVLGRELVGDNRLEAAASIFSLLQNETRFPNLSQDAMTELGVLQGKGSFGARFGFASQQILNEVVRPESILALGLGSAAFRVARLTVFSELAASEASWLTRGFGLRASAAVAGSLAETTVLTLSNPLLGEVTGQRQDWSGLGKSWVSNALLLGSLRLSGGAASFMSNHLASGEGLLERFSRQALPQAGMYGGILLADRLETKLGLKGDSVESDPYLSAFFTWAHFNLGGFLAQKALGENFLAWERKMDFFAEKIHLPKNSASRGLWQKFLNPIQEGLDGLKEIIPQVALAGNPRSTKASEDFLDLQQELSEPMAMAKENEGGGKVYPREARMKELLASPRKADLQDVLYWIHEMNVQTSNPRQRLEAVKINYRLEGNAGLKTEEAAQVKLAMEKEINQTSLRQLEAFNRLLEMEYKQDRAIIHGLRFLEYVVFLHRDPNMKKRAHAMRSQWDVVFERDAKKPNPFRNTPPKQIWENLEDAAQIGDEVRIWQWVDALLKHGKLSMLEKEIALHRMRLHPNSLVRFALLGGFDKTPLGPEEFMEFWKEGERERLLGDFKSLERRRCGRALDILSLFLSHGVAEAAPLYHQFLSLLTNSQGLPREDIEDAADAAVHRIDSYDREERWKRLMESPKEATMADLGFWSGEIHELQDLQKMNDALKVLYRMKDFTSRPSNSIYAPVVQEFYRSAAERLHPESFDILALFFRAEYQAGRPMVHGIWFFNKAAELLQNLNLMAHATSLERDYGSRKFEPSDSNEAWAKLEEAVQVEDQEVIFDWLRILAKDQGKSVDEDRRILNRIFEHSHAMVRGPIYENFKIAGEGFFHEMWEEGEKYRIFEDLKALGRERTSSAMAILEIFAENFVPEAARLIQKFAPILESGNNLTLEDIEAEEKRIKSKLN